MEKKTISNIIYGLILVLIYHVIHELTHYRIFQYYECEEIMVHLLSVTASNCLGGVLLVNTIHDIIGYTVVPILILIAYLIGRE